MKANAYGHGAVECSFAAKSAGARMLAVALAEEAQELRGAGIDMPVMIIGRSNPDQLRLAMALDLQPCVFTPDDILLLQQICKQEGKRCSVHLKFDTGMCRIGSRSEEELAACLDALRCV